MSQGQPRRPVADQYMEQEPIRYGDVFSVTGELATEVIPPRDAATMQAAENIALGQTQRGGPAAVMQSAADLNEEAGFVSHQESTTSIRAGGVNIRESVVDGKRIVTEYVDGQVVGQYIAPEVPMKSPITATNREAITIGEALEATALSGAGDKPVDRTDAAAIMAAEMRATGGSEVPPGGVGSAAQSAAVRNERTMVDEEKITLSDVLAHVTEKMEGDKVVTRVDAEGVIGAELRNDPDMVTTPGGVAEMVAAAASVNQNRLRTMSF
ncbi:late embryogenesis abundant protein D-34-like [Carica papaya]|uniref:late embryogenesis abundant protein D-34-like n=1 Tax=Carica papaya TaxID=3649 RepID=UPI000B8C9E47|nr:late embryogenesis abundant protein D-34-like [Carica papaya]